MRQTPWPANAARLTIEGTAVDNNVDKTLYGEDPEAEQELPEPMDIEVEIVEDDDGDLEVDMAEGDAIELVEVPFDGNLAEVLDQAILGRIASEVQADVDIDKRSRADWEETYKNGLELLGLKYEERSDPWQGACGVTHPMITEACVRFQAELITETFPAKGPVLTKVLGKQAPDRLKAARRVQEHMNHELTEVMSEFRPEHERMLWSLPGAGSAFKKVYDDPTLGRQTSVFVDAQDVLLPYGCSDIATSPRVTHVMYKTPNEFRKLQVAGFYVDCDIPEPTRTYDELQQAKDEQVGANDLEDSRIKLYEVQVELDIEGYEDLDGDGEPTGVALPYVLTFVADTNTVVGLRRNWAEEDILKCKRQHFVHYQYIPGFGAYGFGLFHLIGGYAKASTSLLRQLVDSGTLSNLPGGLKSRGLRIKGDDTPIGPGEFRDVDVGSGKIQDNIMPLPYKEPSAVLAGLLEKIIEEGRRFAATADLKISDMSAQAPVGTTLALLERTLKVMSAVQARTHFSLKQELRLIADIIRDHSPEDYDYEPSSGVPAAKRGDFEATDIIPVSDPNAATMAQRVIQYQAALQLSTTAPEIYDLPRLHRQMLEVLGVKDADQVIPLEDDIKASDPMSENMAVLNGKPVKAFMHQDHEAHIAVHTAAMQDPLLMQIMGQNPKAQSIMAAAQAHITEHVAYKYRAMMEKTLGTTLPPEGEQLPPEMEAALSSMMAKAAAQILGENKQAMAAKQAQAQQQDPVLQMQQRELAIKEGELQLKQKQQQIDAAKRADQLKLEEKRMQIEAADKADKTRLADRKQIATEELNEQNTRLKAMHYGNMGRAQDQNILVKDRDRALEALRTLAEIHQNNSLGESGGETPPASPAPPTGAAPATPQGDPSAT